jgi:hypothetical protein
MKATSPEPTKVTMATSFADTGAMAIIINIDIDTKKEIFPINFEFLLKAFILLPLTFKKKVPSRNEFNCGPV